MSLLPKPLILGAITSLFVLVMAACSSSATATPGGQALTTPTASATSSVGGQVAVTPSPSATIGTGGTSVATSTPSTTGTTAPGATSTTTATVSPSGTSTSGGNTINVMEIEFKISSSVTDFQVGVPYTFVIKNDGASPHEFDIMPTGETDVSKTLLHVTSDELSAGASVTKQFTFQNAGSYEFACHLPGHYDAGMKLSITVQ